MKRRTFLVANALMTVGAISTERYKAEAAGRPPDPTVLVEVPDLVIDDSTANPTSPTTSERSSRPPTPPTLRPGFEDPIVYRRDLREWNLGSASQLLEALTKLRDFMGDAAFDSLEATPSPKMGNIAFSQSGPHEWSTPERPSGTRWYVGYYDCATGQVVLYTGDLNHIPEGLGENHPYGSPAYPCHSIVMSHDGTIADLKAHGLLE